MCGWARCHSWPPSWLSPRLRPPQASLLPSCTLCPGKTHAQTCRYLLVPVIFEPVMCMHDMLLHLAATTLAQDPCSRPKSFQASLLPSCTTCPGKILVQTCRYNSCLMHSALTVSCLLFSQEGCLYITLCRLGRSTAIRTQRLICICFVQKPGCFLVLSLNVVCLKTTGPVPAASLSLSCCCASCGYIYRPQPLLLSKGPAVEHYIHLDQL